jgi:hypothetical protein
LLARLRRNDEQQPLWRTDGVVDVDEPANRPRPPPHTGYDDAIGPREVSLLGARTTLSTSNGADGISDGRTNGDGNEPESTTSARRMRFH